MAIEDVVRAASDFVRDHRHLAEPMVFALGFAESIPFLSWLVPSSGIFLAIGGLMGANGAAFWPLCLAAALGASLGDILCYILGRWLKQDIARIWPLSRYADALPRAEAFFARWGMVGIVLGKFLGPMRPFLPLVAGAAGMSHFKYVLASAVSSLLWAAAFLGPAHYGARVLLD